MNRSLKCRGKQLHTYEWIYGHLVIDPEGRCRIYYHPFKEASSNSYQYVFPTTICQFTGKLDKNGTEIYEGDILHFHYKDEEDGLEGYSDEQVFWSEKLLGFVLDDSLKQDKSGEIALGEYDTTEMEIIGNIHRPKKP